jgi:hypothetical protein
VPMTSKTAGARVVAAAHRQGLGAVFIKANNNLKKRYYLCAYEKITHWHSNI